MFEIARNIVWGPATILLIVLLGVVLCIKTEFRALKNPVKLFRDTLFSPDDNKSSYEAMCTALGGTIGVGNTIGVAGAMLEGGPGALLWMVIASFFGMVIKESVSSLFTNACIGQRLYFYNSRSPACSCIIAAKKKTLKRASFIMHFV